MQRGRACTLLHCTAASRERYCTTRSDIRSPPEDSGFQCWVFVPSHSQHKPLLPHPGAAPLQLQGLAPLWSWQPAARDRTAANPDTGMGVGSRQCLERTETSGHGPWGRQHWAGGRQGCRVGTSREAPGQQPHWWLSLGHAELTLQQLSVGTGLATVTQPNRAAPCCTATLSLCTPAPLPW